MKIVLFGATGMLGQGALRECLLDDEVERVLVVTRTPTGQPHPKLREIIHTDFSDLTPLRDEVAGYDACLFCLGVSSTGMSETEYRRITHDLALAVAGMLAEVNPGSTFVYISGKGTDSSGAGRIMWARVKGQTENALLALPLRAYMLRPGLIQPRHGAVSKVRAYRVLYRLMAPVFPALTRLMPNSVITTEQLGRAMLAIARDGASTHVLESTDLNALA